jgi:hypothetical protein
MTVPAAPATIEAIVTRIAAAHQRLVDAIAPLTDAQLQAPLLADQSSIKDALAHLAFWDERLLHAIAPAEGPGAFRLAPPVIADIPFDAEWLTTVNARIHALNRDRSLAAVRAEFDDTRRRLLDVVGTLTLFDVFDPNGLSALLGEPFAPMLLGAYEHYDEHTEDFEKCTG